MDLDLIEDGLDLPALVVLEREQRGGAWTGSSSEVTEPGALVGARTGRIVDGVLDDPHLEAILLLATGVRRGVEGGQERAVGQPLLGREADGRADPPQEVGPPVAGGLELGVAVQATIPQHQHPWLDRAQQAASRPTSLAVPGAIPRSHTTWAPTSTRATSFTWGQGPSRRVPSLSVVLGRPKA